MIPTKIKPKHAVLIFIALILGLIVFRDYGFIRFVLISTLIWSSVFFLLIPLLMRHVSRNKISVDILNNEVILGRVRREGRFSEGRMILATPKELEVTLQAALDEHIGARKYRLRRAAVVTIHSNPDRPITAVELDSLVEIFDRFFLYTTILPMTYRPLR